MIVRLLGALVTTENITFGLVWLFASVAVAIGLPFFAKQDGLRRAGLPADRVAIYGDGALYFYSLGGVSLAAVRRGTRCVLRRRHERSLVLRNTGSLPIGTLGPMTDFACRKSTDMRQMLRRRPPSAPMVPWRRADHARIVVMTEAVTAQPPPSNGPGSLLGALSAVVAQRSPIGGAAGLAAGACFLLSGAQFALFAPVVGGLLGYLLVGPVVHILLGYRRT